MLCRPAEFKSLDRAAATRAHRAPIPVVSPVRWAPDKVENTVAFRRQSNRSLPYLQPGTARTIRFKLLRTASDDLTELSLP
jgi:hypothetical protein